MSDPAYAEMVRMKRRAYYEANKARIKAREAARYYANPFPAKARAKKWAKQNRGRHLLLKKERYYRDHEKNKAARRASNSKRIKSGKVAAYKVKLKAEDSDVFNRYNRSYRKRAMLALNDFYVTQLLKQRYGIAHPTSEQIEERRSIIAAKRTQKMLRMMNAAVILSQ